MQCHKIIISPTIKIIDVLTVIFTPKVLRYPAEMEVASTGANKLLCIYGVSSNTSIAWKMNGSVIRQTFSFPNAERLSQVAETCFTTHVYHVYGTSCSCILEELERLQINFPVAVTSTSQNSYGVFSTNFFHSDEPTFLESIKCTGVTNRFLSLLVIKNASFPVAENASVKVTSILYNQSVSYDFQMTSSK